MKWAGAVGLAAGTLVLTLGFAGPLPVAVAGAALSYVVACRLSPVFALVTVLAAISFVPYWFGATILGYVPVSSLVLIASVPGLVFRAAALQLRFRIRIWDAFILLLGAVVVLLAVSGASMYGHAFVLLSQWMPAYVFGRLIVQQIPRRTLFAVFAVVFTLVAALSVIEFFTGWNPYAGSAPITEQYAKIGAIQERGGVIRSEWAFGHSIALGNSLAMALPLIIASPLSSAVRAAMLAVIALGTVFTFSRSAMTTAVLAVVFSLWAGRGGLSTRTRIATMVGGLIAVLIAIPILSDVFDHATAESTRSADHRWNLLQMLGSLNPMGTADGYIEVGGVFNWYGVVSIDNAFIRLGVNFGWIVGALLVIAAVFVLFHVATRRATDPELSVAAVVPALMTVALITQFGSIVWLYVGLAVGAATLRSSSPAATGHPLKIREKEAPPMRKTEPN